MEVTVLGVDLAKNVFQLHGVDASGKAVLKKKVRRARLIETMAQLKPCLVGMEACSGAHYWAREFEKWGHTVRQIAPQFVKPYVKSNKTDAADAEAICEAVGRPSMRFVSPKTIGQQDTQCLHRIRSRLVGSRTALCNEIRGLLSEYGIILPVGIQKLRRGLAEELESALALEKITPLTNRAMGRLADQLNGLDVEIKEIERELNVIHKNSAASQKIEKIPGIGLLSATAVVAAVGDAQQFKNGRQLSAWIGLVPRQHSSGGKERLLGISKRGDVYLRTLLIHGARSVLRHAEKAPEGREKEWLKQLIERRGMNRATVALANKNARKIWVLLTKEEEHYRVAA